MIDPNRPPPLKIGYKWEYRKGCECKACPWKGNCLGESWPYWYCVKADSSDGDACSARWSEEDLNGSSANER